MAFDKRVDKRAVPMKRSSGLAADHRLHGIPELAMDRLKLRAFLFEKLRTGTRCG
jgi:hypothetical protein